MIELNMKDVRVNTWGAKGRSITASLDTHVELTHIPSGITVEHSGERSIHRSKALAWDKLCTKVDLEWDRVETTASIIEGLRKEVARLTQKLMLITDIIESK